MSLIHFLSVGKSLSDVKDRPSRYRMTRDNLLPNFWPDRESCATDAAGVGGDEPPASVSVAPVLTAERAAGEPPAPAKTGPAAGPQVALPKGRWPLVRNPFARRTPAKAAAAAVQSELPWADMKVARNDLNDSDLEVVPSSQPVTAVEAGPLPAAAPQGESRLRALWRRVRARWSKPDQP